QATLGAGAVVAATHQVKLTRPERPVLAVQAKGLGKPAQFASAQKGPFNSPLFRCRTSLSGSNGPSPGYPGLRPGLPERSFQDRTALRQPNEPFRIERPFARLPRPSAWAARTILSGSKSLT